MAIARLCGALVVLALLVAVSPLAAQQAVTLEGTLVDSKCYLMDNRLAGNDHGAMTGCGTMCLKGGSPAGLLTKDNQFHALIASAAALADYVGQTVRVTGAINSGVLVPTKVERNADGRWQEIKLGAMM